MREDLADFYGSIATADAAVGRLLDTLTETGLDATTWVVFVTDHGPAFPRAKSTLYDAGTGIALIVRPPTGRALRRPSVYDDLFSGVDLVPTLLDLLGIDVPTDVEGVSHAHNLLAPDDRPDPARDHVYTTKTYHDAFDPDSGNPHKGLQLHRELRAAPAAGPAVGHRGEPVRAGRRAVRQVHRVRSGSCTICARDPTETNNLLAE